MSAARKYDTSLQINLESLENPPTLNEDKQNYYGKSKIIKGFGGCKSAISHNYFSACRFFVYSLSYGYSVNL